MTWPIGLVLVVLVLFFIPRRIIFLHRNGRLNDRSFAMTFALGWAIALLLFYYLGLFEILLNRGDPVLTGLGLLIAVVNFILSYPIALLVYRHILGDWLDHSLRD